MDVHDVVQIGTIHQTQVIGYKDIAFQEIANAHDDICIGH